jgi:tetratricopeptide (TPR) repeat protein
MRRNLLHPLGCSSLLAAATCLAVAPFHAQPARAAFAQSSQKQNDKQQQAPPADKGYSSSSTTQAEAGSATGDLNAPPDPHKFDRYHAEQDIEVGTFYLHKGDPDAAIPRLEEAARLWPEYGKPRRLLAECYEKKHDPENAVKYLKEYLKVYPAAPDAKKVREKIKKLEKQES